MNSNEIISFNELFKKIFKYKYFILLKIILISSSVYIWETNKKIIYKHTLRIYPLSIIEFEKSFPDFSYNKRELDHSVESNIDSLYSLNFTPLNFLYSYNDVLKETLLEDNIFEPEFNSTKANLFISLDTTYNLNTLYVNVISEQDEIHVKKFMNLLFDKSNEKFKNKLDIIFNQHVEDYLKKIETINSYSKPDEVKIKNYEFEINKLSNLLKKINTVSFVSYNLGDLNINNNKLSKLKLTIFSILVSFFMSLLIIIFLPNKKLN